MNKLIDVKSIIPKAIQHFWKKIMLFINEELDWVVNLKPKKNRQKMKLNGKILNEKCWLITVIKEKK